MACWVCGWHAQFVWRDPTSRERCCPQPEGHPGGADPAPRPATKTGMATPAGHVVCGPKAAGSLSCNPRCKLPDLVSGRTRGATSQFPPCLNYVAYLALTALLRGVGLWTVVSGHSNSLSMLVIPSSQPYRLRLPCHPSLLLR